MSRCIKLLPCTGTCQWHTTMNPDAVSWYPGMGHGCKPGWGEVTDLAPSSCSLAISVWKEAAAGKHGLVTAVVGGCASPLQCLLSVRQKIGCKEELTHTCLQLKPEHLTLEVTWTLLLSSISCKRDGFPQCLLLCGDASRSSGKSFFK